MSYRVRYLVSGLLTVLCILLLTSCGGYDPNVSFLNKLISIQEEGRDHLVIAEQIRLMDVREVTDPVLLELQEDFYTYNVLSYEQGYSPNGDAWDILTGAAVGFLDPGGTAYRISELMAVSRRIEAKFAHLQEYYY